MIDYLRGKKTYIIGGGMMLIGLFRVLSGDTKEGVDMILDGAGFCTLRAGVETITKECGPQ